MTRAGVDKDCVKTEGFGGVCWWRVEAAAAVSPIERRAEGKRRKVEENSLKVFPEKRERRRFSKRGRSVVETG